MRRHSNELYYIPDDEMTVGIYLGIGISRIELYFTVMAHLEKKLGTSTLGCCVLYEGDFSEQYYKQCNTVTGDTSLLAYVVSLFGTHLN